MLPLARTLYDRPFLPWLIHLGWSLLAGMTLAFIGTTGCLRAQCGPREDSADRCADGRDNDGDDFVDCLDQDCAQYSFCMTDGGCTTCSDGGAEAATDAAAPDAAIDAGDAGTDSGVCMACPGVEVCDGFDNDGDATIDFPDCGPGLELWYRFEETSGPVIDSSGNGHDGVPLGEPMQGLPGAIGNEIGLNPATAGGDDSVETTGLLIDAAAGFTLELFHGVISDPGGCAIDMASDPTDPATFDFYLAYNHTANTWSSVIYDDAGVSAGYQSPSLVDDGLSHHHVAMTWDGAVLATFVDGLEVASQTFPGFDAGVFSGTLLLAPLDVNCANRFASYFDELKIWSVARTEAEVCGDAHGTYSLGPPASCAGIPAP